MSYLGSQATARRSVIADRGSLFGLSGSMSS
jgi:hypothetical protein